MALAAIVTTLFGEQRELYVRLNNLSVSNHGAPARALFRGFASQAAFTSGGHYLWEQEIEFTSDVTANLWDQAYTKLRELEAFKDATDC